MTFDSDYLISTIQSFIDQCNTGTVTDPEMDFSSLQQTDELGKRNKRIFEKTGKIVKLDHINMPMKIIIFFDINNNLKEKFLNPDVVNMLDGVISHFGSDYSIELRDGYNTYIGHLVDDLVLRLHSYKSDQFETHIDDILDYCVNEIQNRNIVLVYSDFLLCSISSDDALLDDIICIKALLPVFSSYFHQYYIKDLAMPVFPHCFSI